MSCSKFENLANETIMDIFEYLDAVNLYPSFYNLNYRLNAILNDKRLYISVDFSSKVNDKQFHFTCENIIPQIDDRIISCIIAHDYRIYALITLFGTFATFRSLRILTLIDITKKDNLEIILPNLHYLITLNIYTNEIDNETVINDICALILSKKLPSLKKCSLSFCNNCVFKDVTKCDVEHLTIGWCSVADLIHLLHHTPTLKTLIIRYLCNYDYSTLKDTNLILKEVNLFLYCVPFNNIELLVKCMPLLSILKIKGQLDDTNYTDAQQWEPLLSASLEHLRIFSLNITVITSSLNTTNIIEKFGTDFWTLQWNLSITCRYSRSLILSLTGERDPTKYLNKTRLE
ncbi:unnamed protein product [Didymodactylos carnosus]|uniref:F-box domain-containing protein n=1 Tax=Didymodactylos carnosus TaxID=1234261 RepID=A0A815QPW9_9BILA|nr:unnamed protein product [Didymodactylos carnosus]CAF1466214.1 unnamed protein product [Didymodactylos carnosus]CAF3747168.1 unnamed protein product [Didymodactylos carnosus]CAF4335350.1 unnamed protein product [Didymodactylos carnosus]